MKITKTTFSIFLFFLFITVSVLGQVKDIDSLKIELLKHKEMDSTRVNLLNKIAFSYRRKDLSKTLDYLKESDSITNIINFQKGKARSFYVRGVAELMQSNYNEAIQHLESAIQIYLDINYMNDIGVCYMALGIVYYYQGYNEKTIINYIKAQQIDEKWGIKKNIITNTYNIGTVYVAMGKYKEGLINYNETLKLYRENNDKKAEGNVLNSIANVYKDLGNYPSALENYQKSLSIYEKINDSIGIARAYSGLGNILRSQSRDDEALEYFKKALSIQEIKKNKKNIAKVKISIGNLYKYKKDYDSAIKLFEEALTIGRQIKAENDIADYLNNLGNIHFKIKNYTAAFTYFTESKNINQKIKNKKSLSYSYLGLADCYVQQQKYNRALVNVLKSKEISDELGLLNYQKSAEQLLSKIYRNTGQYSKALSSHEQFKILHDSLYNIENIQKMAELEYEFKYQKALDSASIRELQLTKTVTATNKDLVKTQRNYLWAIIGVLLVSMLLGSIIFYQKLKNAKARTQNITTEQKLLRSQMTPHFIFNSLSVLQGMILNKEDKKSISYLSKFSKLMRITLENSRDKLVLLSQELLAIENYLALQNLENEAYQYSVLVDENINTEAFEIPPMLIQPFVENAIEHAFINQKKNRKINIHLSFTDDKLLCTISDNGVGSNYENGNKRKDKKSLATTITSERLKILSKDLKMEGFVMVEDRQVYGEQGTIVTLQIPHKII